MSHQVKRAIHWAKVEAAIHKHGVEGVAIADLAAELRIDKKHPDFRHALKLLEKQGKLRASLGRSESGEPAVVVQSYVPDVATKRRAV